MKISIVVPTLNESKLLPRLLDSIRNQTFKDYEIIVADAGSSDGTREIASSYGARVVRGGMPSRGRNAGARRARGQFLFFFDADVVIPPEFLETAYEEMEERYLDLATCEIRPISDLVLDRVIHHFINASVRATLRLDPHAMGFAIFVTKRLFERVGGFDETITVGEDSEFVKRAAKVRSLEILERPHLHVSVRRFEREGRLEYAKTGIRLNLYRAFKGEVREEQIEYKFAEYDRPKEPAKRTFLNQLEGSLMGVEERIREISRKGWPTEQERKLAAQLLEEARQQLRSLFVGERKNGTADP